MRGLLISEPWIDKILAGEKSWEMRSKPTLIRGDIALIRKGSGMVVGTAEVIDSLSPLTRANYMSFHDRHAIPAAMLDQVLDGGWVYPWVLADVRALKEPVPYTHASGAVIFVNLDDSVAAAIRRQTGDSTGDRAAATRPVVRSASSKEIPMSDSAEQTAVLDDGPTLHSAGTPIFVFRPQAAQAHGYPTAKGFTVQTGSTAMRNGSPRVKRDGAVRDELVSSGVLVPDTADPRLYRFAEDHEFSSASAAAGVIKDGNASGPSLWTDVNSGQTLKDYLDRQRSASR